jgi:L-histidine Nalpha-methyltransferase
MRTDRLLPPGFLARALRADALAGLSAAPKWLPPKWFYDAYGSALFEKITELPEYYPARGTGDPAGRSADDRRPHRLVCAGGTGVGLVGEDQAADQRAALGGTLRSYPGADVSESAVSAAGHALAREYPGLAVRAVVADIEERASAARWRTVA